MQFTPDRPPLRFVSPPGWPQPSETWTARNQGWQPPAGWTPPVERRVPAAPPQWRFWQADPRHWSDFRRPFAAGITAAIVWSSITVAAGLALLAFVLGAHPDTAGAIAPGLVLIVLGGIRLVTAVLAHRAVDGRIRQSIATAAPHVRRDVDTHAYRDYLWEVSQTGRSAMHFDEFAFHQDAVGWGAPSAYLPKPLRWTAQPPVRSVSFLRRRLPFLVTLGVLAMLFFGFLVFAVVSAWASGGVH